ncbi:hypothetical protein NC651_035214 [Populus alba x Populus x berolinensis]|nr:hypothetical protein NC651_035214 [Populus alba x Populus x berolinensis]
METQDLDTVRASRFGATVIMITALYFLTQRFCGFRATVHSTFAQQNQVVGIVTLKRKLGFVVVLALLLWSLGDPPPLPELSPEYLRVGSEDGQPGHRDKRSYFLSTQPSKSYCP